MNNIKIYKTAGYFEVYFWAVALSFCGPMIFLLDILASPLIPNAIPMILLISIYIALTLWKLTKALKRAMRRVCFVKEGIVTIERKNQFMPWEQFSHAYFCRGYRNRGYMILTNKEMNRKQLQKHKILSLVKPFPVFSTNGTLTINFFDTGYGNEIQEFVSEKVKNIYVENMFAHFMR